MQQIENVNKEELQLINAKVQRDYDKLLKRIPRKQLSEKEEKVVDSLTLGTKRNDITIAGSLAIPGVPMAYGILKATVGLITLIPSAVGAPNEEAVPFFEQARVFSENTLKSGLEGFAGSVKLFAIPAGVIAISISSKIYKTIIEDRVNDAKYDKAIIRLIDDTIEQREDSTLDFFNKLIRRVDISENDYKTNLQLLKYVAYHRYMQEMLELGKVTEEDVEEAFDNVVLYLKMMRDDPKSRDKIKNNRFLNILISKYDEKIEEREKQERGYHK